MSDLTRRDFVKQGIIGAAGIATLGTGAILQTGASASSRRDGSLAGRLITCQNLTAPVKEGNYIICPNDEPDFDRLYCALIRQEVTNDTNTVVAETELLYGTYDDPFNGESYAIPSMPAPGSGNHYRYLSRMIRIEETDYPDGHECEQGYGYEDSGSATPRVKAHTLDVNLRTLPRPPAPIVPEIRPGQGLREIPVFVPKKSFSSLPDGVEVTWSKLRRVEIDPRAQPQDRRLWKRRIPGQNNEGVSVILREEMWPQTIFTGQEVMDNNFRPGNAYVYYTEIGYRLPGETAANLLRTAMGSDPVRIAMVKS